MEVGPYITAILYMTVGVSELMPYASQLQMLSQVTNLDLTHRCSSFGLTVAQQWGWFYREIHVSYQN